MSWCAIVSVVVLVAVGSVQSRDTRMVKTTDPASMEVLTVTRPGGQRQLRVFGLGGVVAMDTKFEGHPGRLREVCDGERVLRMLYTDADDLIECQMESDPSAVRKFWLESLGMDSDESSNEVNPDKDILASDVAERVQARSQDTQVKVTKVKAVDELKHFVQMLDVVGMKAACERRHHGRAGTTPRRSPRALFIFPGTNWCGNGNQADDLGESVDADRCCREHDTCPYYIGSLSEGFGHFNMRLYTISHCACDEQ